MYEAKLSIREVDNKHLVIQTIGEEETILATCDSNAAAWRELDRAHRRPTWKTAKQDFWGR